MEEGEVGGISDRRSADDGESGGLCSDDGEGESPPGRASATQEIVFDVVLLLAKAEAKERDAEKVREDDGEVEQMNAHQGYSRDSGEERG